MSSINSIRFVFVLAFGLLLSACTPAVPTPVDDTYGETPVVEPTQVVIDGETHNLVVGNTMFLPLAGAPAEGFWECDDPDDPDQSCSSLVEYQAVFGQQPVTETGLCADLNGDGYFQKDYGECDFTYTPGVLTIPEGSEFAGKSGKVTFQERSCTWESSGADVSWETGHCGAWICTAGSAFEKPGCYNVDVKYEVVNDLTDLKASFSAEADIGLPTGDHIVLECDFERTSPQEYWENWMAEAGQLSGCKLSLGTLVDPASLEVQATGTATRRL